MSYFFQIILLLNFTTQISETCLHSEAHECSVVYFAGSAIGSTSVSIHCLFLFVGSKWKGWGQFWSVMLLKKSKTSSCDFFFFNRQDATNTTESFIHCACILASNCTDTIQC